MATSKIDEFAIGKLVPAIPSTARDSTQLGGRPAEKPLQGPRQRAIVRRLRDKGVFMNSWGWLAIASCVGLATGCLPETDCFQTATCPPASPAAQEAAVADWSVTPPDAAEHETERVLEIGNPSIDVDAGSEESDVQLVADSSFDVGTRDAADSGASENDASAPVADVPTPCTPESCAAANQDCDSTSGQCVFCKQRPADSPDFHVDLRFAGTPTGSLGCPFRTITAALAAANASAAAQKTIHIGPGTYDIGAGEQFPLQLRNGISLVGSGAASTILKGTGSLDHSRQGGAQNGVYQVTVAIGDPTAINTIADIGFQATSSTAQASSYAVFCDRGNAPSAILNPVPDSFPPPNVTASRLNIGAGYMYGVVVSNSDTDGCNLSMTSSVVDGSASGIWAVGCGTGTGTNKIAAVTLGDGTITGSNTFKNLVSNILPGFGCGLIAWDCVSPIRVLRNTISDSECGMDLATHDATVFQQVEGNTLSRLSRMGIQVGQAGVVDTFIDNTLTGIGAAGALRVLKTAQIKKARNNRIVANELGLVIMGASLASRIIDFGNAADPGMNTFSCNSSTSGASGFDVLLGLDPSGTASVFSARQNAWDHVPPTASDMANGTDVANSSAALQPTVDAAGATGAPACASPRVPGP